MRQFLISLGTPSELDNTELNSSPVDDDPDIILPCSKEIPGQASDLVRPPQIKKT